jgi:hypothetical protein
LFLTPEARKILFGYEQKTIFGTTEKAGGIFYDLLSKALTNYQSLGHEGEFIFTLQDALLWVNRAYSSGVVKPSEGVFIKYSDLKKRQEKVEQDAETFYAELRVKENECSELRGQIKLLKDLLQKTTPKGKIDE